MPANAYHLPLDLLRWDRSPGGDALIVPLWSDVRPLRGAAGLVDWRLCGHLSELIRQGRLTGAAGEKLLLVTNRVPWRRVLAVGMGESTAFGEAGFRSAAEGCLETLRKLGATSLAIAFPGRDIDLIRPDRALGTFLDALAQDEGTNGPWLDRFTVIDVVAAARAPAAPQRLRKDTR